MHNMEALKKKALSNEELQIIELWNQQTYNDKLFYTQ